MNPLLRPLPLALLGFAAVALLMRWFPVAALLAVAGAASVVFESIRQSGRNADEALVNLSSENRGRLRPLLDLRSELHELVRQHRDLPTIAVVGQEALQEADRVVASATQLIQLRTSLLRQPENLEAVDSLGRIDNRLDGYTEALREVRNRLTVEATRQRTPTPQDESEMDGMMARLRSLSISVDEASDVVRDSNR